MKYFIRGTAHFFNLFADFLEHCENIIYFIIAIILLILIIYGFKKIKANLKAVLFSYLGLFKFISFTLAFTLLLMCTILTYLANNQFMILSLLVVAVDFIKKTCTIYDDKILHQENLKIFLFKDFTNILIPNLILIFFKITYWAELYCFNLNEIKNYFITMAIIIFIEIITMIIFKVYSIYTKVFCIVKKTSKYKKIQKILDFFKILKISNNQMNYFRLVKIFFQHEIVTKDNRKNIIGLCFYLKSVETKIELDNTYKSNLDVYNDFKTLNKRLGCEKNEEI